MQAQQQPTRSTAAALKNVLEEPEQDIPDDLAVSRTSLCVPYGIACRFQAMRLESRFRMHPIIRNIIRVATAQRPSITRLIDPCASPTRAGRRNITHAFKDDRR